MNPRHPLHISRTGGHPPEDRVTALPVALSAVLHLLVLAAVIWMPNWTPDRSRMIPAIDVTMVSLKDAPPGTPGPGPAAQPAPEAKPEPPAPPAPPAAPEPAPAAAPPPPEKAPPEAEVAVTPPKPAPVPEAEVSIAPPKPKAKPVEPKPEKVTPVPKGPPEVKKSLKKETYRPSPAVARAIAELEKKVDSGRPAAVNAAIDKLKTAAGPPAAIERLRAKAGTGSGAGAGTGTGAGGGGGGGGGPLSIEDMYRLEVAYAVNKNWAFSESLGGGRSDLVAEVAFSVLPDGRIKDLWFDRKSGNSYLDESVRRAILKSEPLPPHPRGVRRPDIIVGLRFSPRGVVQ